jgi:hypothetical protein
VTDYQLLPPLSAEEYAALKVDIAVRGVLVPIEVDEAGTVLDGHHRLRAWEEVRAEGVAVPPYPRVVRADMSEADKVAHVLALNLARRHLEKEARVALVRRLRAETGWSAPKIAAETGLNARTVLRDLAASATSVAVHPDARITDRNGVRRPAHVPPAEPTVRTLIEAGLATGDGIPAEPPELVAMRRLYIDFAIKRFPAAQVAALVSPDMREFYASVGEAFVPWLATFAAELRGRHVPLRVIGGSEREAAEVGP